MPKQKGVNLVYRGSIILFLISLEGRKCIKFDKTCGLISVRFMARFSVSEGRPAFVLTRFNGLCLYAIIVKEQLLFQLMGINPRRNELFQAFDCWLTTAWNGPFSRIISSIVVQSTHRPPPAVKSLLKGTGKQ